MRPLVTTESLKVINSAEKKEDAINLNVLDDKIEEMVKPI